MAQYEKTIPFATEISADFKTNAANYPDISKDVSAMAQKLVRHQWNFKQPCTYREMSEGFSPVLEVTVEPKSVDIYLHQKYVLETMLPADTLSLNISSDERKNGYQGIDIYFDSTFFLDPVHPAMSPDSAVLVWRSDWKIDHDKSALSRFYTYIAFIYTMKNNDSFRHDILAIAVSRYWLYVHDDFASDVKSGFYLGSGRWVPVGPA